MYKAHFGLSQSPFGLTPDTEFFHQLPSHTEALQVLVTALQNGEGFIKVTGEVGTGKTMLCRKLLKEMGASFRFAYLPNPCLSPTELLFSLAEELEVRFDTAQTKESQLQIQLQQRLLELAREEQQVVLLVDEAQALSWEALETLRLLGNLETEKHKLLQIVLFGQPELDEKIQQNAFRQLAQRITFSYQLRPLTINELGSYIEHRLYTSGYRGAPLFTQRQFRQIYIASRGIPRLINILCHKALMLCYGKGGRTMTAIMVRDAIKDTPSACQPVNFPLWRLFPAALLLGGIIYLFSGGANL